MSKIILIKCDHCGNPAQSYRYEIGCEMDPSGNGYNTSWEYVDICEECKNTKYNDKKLKKIQKF